MTHKRLNIVVSDDVYKQFDKEAAKRQVTIGQFLVNSFAVDQAVRAEADDNEIIIKQRSGKRRKLILP